MNKAEIMRLADGYAIAVAQAPHSPRQREKKLAEQRIEKARSVLEAALEQQQAEQEPVAAVLLQSKQNYERNFGPSAAADWIYSDLLELLDTTPPQRKPLTDELEAAFKDGWQSAKAAHGIKEGT